MTANRSAILTAIALCEGTQLGNDPGYDVIVTGVDGHRETFSDFSAHPFANGRKAKMVRTGLFSTASGRYQETLANWRYYSDLLKLPDFSPMSQDLMAIQQMREAKALPLIDAGRFDEAIQACAHLWASLPGAGYGQPEHPIDIVRSYYLAAGGTVSAS